MSVVVIGLDAADHRLLDRWSDDGTLPAFRELAASALRVPMANPPGIYTGAVWPCFTTGVSPARHGRYFMLQLRSGSYDVTHFHADDLGHEPFWEALDRAGRRVALVDVPKMPLARPLRHGIALSDWGAHDPEGPTRSHPPTLAREIERRFGRDPVGPCDMGRADAKGLERLRDALIARVARKRDLGLDLLGREQWDLFVIAFGDLHCAGHQLWHVHDPSHSRHDPSLVGRLGDPLRAVYAAVDDAVGAIVRAAGPDTTVLLWASHGMAIQCDATHLLEEVLQRLEGRAASRRVAAVEPVRKAWRRMPALLRAPLQPLADRFYDALRARGRSGRRFFQVPTNNNCAGIRVNRVGREPRGLVAPGAPFEKTCSELAAELLALRDVRTGRPVVREVLRTAEAFSGERLDDLPDLLVRWHRDSPISGVESPRVGRVERPYWGNRTGDHRSPGLLLARSPGLVPGVAEPASPVDLGPTIAALLDVSLDDVDGRPIGGVVARGQT